MIAINNMNSAMEYQDFINYLIDQDRSPITVRGYVSDIQLFMRWFNKKNEVSFELQNWAPADLRNYRQFLIDSGAKPPTINRKLAALVAYGHWAVQSERIDRNPALHIRSMERAPLSPKWLDKSQRAALVRAIDNDLRISRQRYPRLWVMRLRDAAMVITLLNTGLRVGELCSLRTSDVHLSERKGTIIVRAGKGQKYRIVPLNGSTRQLIGDWLSVRPETNAVSLFVGQRNSPVGTHSIQRAVERYATAAGLENVTPHTLRHSFAKALIDEGVTLDKVAALLGHSNLNTTRIYTTPSEQDLEDAISRMKN